MEVHHEQNRISWNAATQRHRSHKPNLPDEFAADPPQLFPEDLSLLGQVKGKRVAHLQCNDGQDTLSIAHHLGAVATGVDISDTAIELAQALSRKTGIAASFIRADIFDWFNDSPHLFDVIYTSYGAICWIADLQRWGAGIAKRLQPGGRLVFLDFHPLAGVFDYAWQPTMDYMGGRAIPSEGVGDYVGNDWASEYQNPAPSVEFAWGLGEIVSALLGAGLVLQHLVEYPYMNGWQRAPDMQELPGRRFTVPPGKPTLALMFSIVAAKPLQ